MRNLLVIYIFNIAMQWLEDEFAGDLKQGSYWFADGEGNEVSVVWDEDRVVVALWDHERGPAKAGADVPPSYKRLFALARDHLSEELITTLYFTDKEKATSTPLGENDFLFRLCFGLGTDAGVALSELERLLGISNVCSQGMLALSSSLANRAFSSPDYELSLEENDTFFKSGRGGLVKNVATTQVAIKKLKSLRLKAR